METEDYFPRGGGTAAADSVIVESTSENQRQDFNKRKSKSSDGDAHVGTSDSFHPSANRRSAVNVDGEAVFAGKLTAELCKPGLLVLVCVRQIFDTELRVELPNSLFGIIKAEDISVDFPKNGSLHLYRPGQLLTAKVVSTQAKRHNSARHRILLTTEPSAVNSSLLVGDLKRGLSLICSVVSKEDNGFVMSVGVDGAIAGFLSNEQFPPEFAATSLVIGQTLLCRLMQDVSANARAPRLTANLSSCSGSPDGISCTSLLPGVPFSASVVRVTQQGAFVTIGTSDAKAFISQEYLPPNRRSLQKLQKEMATTTLKVAVSYVMPNTNLLGLTAVPNVVDLAAERARITFQGLKVGATVKAKVVERLARDAIVLDVCRTEGITETSNTVPLYCSRANLNIPTDASSDEAEKMYPIGSEHKCRVTDFRLLSAQLLVTCRKSSLKQAFVSVLDATPGDAVTATVERVLPGKGLLAKIHGSISGYIPIMHCYDMESAAAASTAPKMLEKKFAIGSELPCRVLAADADRMNVRLTARRSLVESDATVIADCAAVAVGALADGIVAHIGDAGTLVELFGNAYGWISSQDFENNCLFNGQSIRVSVLSYDANATRMRVIPVGEDGNPLYSIQAKMQRLRGKVWRNCVVVAPADDGNGWMVRVSNEAIDDELTAYISKDQIYDVLPSDKIELTTWLSQDERLGHAVCIGAKSGIPLVSCKPLLVNWVEKNTDTKFLPTSFDQLEQGKCVIGTVSKELEGLGVLVTLAGNATDGFPLKGLSNTSQMDDGVHPRVGQTLIGRIASVDRDKRRFSLSLRLRDCCPLRHHLLALSLLRQVLDFQLRLNRHLHIPPIGKLVRIRQLVKIESGNAECVVMLRNGRTLPGRIAAIHLPADQEFGSDEEERSAILLDKAGGVLQLSLQPALLVKRRAKKVQHGAMRSATVLAKNEYYYVVRLDCPQDRRTTILAYMPRRTHPNLSPRLPDHADYGLMKSLKSVSVFAGPDVHECPYLCFALPETLPVDRNNMPLSEPTLELQTVKKRRRYTRGQFVIAKVLGPHPEFPMLISVQLPDGSKARIHASELADTFRQGEPILRNFLKQYTDQRVKVRVIETKQRIIRLPNDGRRHKLRIIHCTMSPIKLTTKGTRDIGIKNVFTPGEKIVGFPVQMPYGFWVVVNSRWTGRVDRFSISGDPDVIMHPENYIKFKAPYLFTVTGVNDEQRTLQLKFAALGKRHKSTIRALQPNEVYVARIGHFRSPRDGFSLTRSNGEPQLLKLYFLNIQKRATMGLTELTDDYDELPSILKQLKGGALLKVKTLTPYQDSNAWLVTTRASELTSSVEDEHSLSCPVKDVHVMRRDQLHSGQVLRGFVASIDSNGVTVMLGPSIFGRLPKHWAALRRSKGGIKKVFVQGMLITVAVMSVGESEDDPTIQLSMLKCHTNIDPERKLLVESPVSLITAEEKATERKRLLGSTNIKLDRGGWGDADDEESLEKRIKIEIPPVTVDVSEDPGFNWGPESFAPDRLMNVGSTGVFHPSIRVKTEVKNDTEADETEPEILIDEDSTNKQSERKPMLLKQEELAIQDAGGSASDFDQKLSTTPDSSELWLRYMAYFLKRGEVQNARQTAERALKIINYREENERLNVWLALLNLEHQHGSAETLEDVFKRALQACDAGKVYRQMLKIYQHSEEIAEADQLLEEMLKRLKRENDEEVWYIAGQHYMSTGRADKCRAIMQRALTSLPPKQYASCVCRFAQLEYAEGGDAERGATLFEQVLAAYPRRTDIWTVYADMLTKHADNPHSARSVYERVTSMAFSAHKMRSFFKKWLEFEQRNGTQESTEQVKRRAVTYVENLEETLGL